MQTLSPIFCIHHMNDRITLDDGEDVCGNCGTVLGRGSNTISIINSKTSLSQDFQLGGRQNSNFMSEKYIKLDIDLIVISNICHALNLPQFISHDIFKWYKKIYKSINMTRAKIIFLVIYTICRYNTIPLNEESLGKTIGMYLHVKNTPNTLKVISKSLSFLTNDNIPILQKIGFTLLMKSSPNFILFSKLKSLNGKYDENTISHIRELSLTLISKSKSTDSYVIKKIIKTAMIRCGVC